MNIIVNAKPREVLAACLPETLIELGLTSPAIATAVNGSFVARDARAGVVLQDGDQLEVLSPMQGG